MSLEEEIRAALNRHSAERESDTPDFILAMYLMECLAIWDRSIARREKWNHRG